MLTSPIMKFQKSPFPTLPNRVDYSGGLAFVGAGHIFMSLPNYPNTTEATRRYSELLKHPKWQEKRLKIMKRDEFRCVMCMDGEHTLHVHHKKYLNHKKPWEYPNYYLITLCEKCHAKWHNEEPKQESKPEPKQEPKKFIPPVAPPQMPQLPKPPEPIMSGRNEDLYYPNTEIPKYPSLTGLNLGSLIGGSK